MFTSMAFSVVVLTLGAEPVDAAHIIPNPPQFLIAANINEKGELVIQKYRHVTRLPASAKDKPSGSSYKSSEPVSLEGIVIQSVEGKPISIAEARKRLSRETSILVMSGGEKPSPIYLKALAKDVLIFVFPADAPAFERAQWPVEKPF